MQVLSSSLQISVPEQNLDGPQVGARFQQVGGPTVTQSMRRDAFVDAGPTGSLAACDPDGLIGDRLFALYATSARGKQVELRLAPPPIVDQEYRCEQSNRRPERKSGYQGADHKWPRCSHCSPEVKQKILCSCTGCCWIRF